MAQKRIVLASASPRRREILEGLGVRFEVITSDADESCSQSDPVLFTKTLAERKAQSVYDRLCKTGEQDGAVVIAADTVVFCDGEILGKPRDREDAIRMITLLSGRTHAVATGVAIARDGRICSDVSVTDVFVDPIPRDEIERYADTDEPYDKAGGYAIQGFFGRWISKIDGCYFGVVGLPTNLLFKTFYAATGVYPDEYN